MDRRTSLAPKLHPATGPSESFRESATVQPRTSETHEVVGAGTAATSPRGVSCVGCLRARRPLREPAGLPQRVRYLAAVLSRPPQPEFPPLEPQRCASSAHRAYSQAPCVLRVARGPTSPTSAAVGVACVRLGIRRRHLRSSSQRVQSQGNHPHRQTLLRASAGRPSMGMSGDLEPGCGEIGYASHRWMCRCGWAGSISGWGSRRRPC